MLKLAEKEYVDSQCKGVNGTIDSMAGLETFVINNYGKQLFLVNTQPIDFNGCVIPEYSMICIPFAYDGADMMGFATNTNANAFYAIGHTWTSGGVWTAKKIY